MAFADTDAMGVAWTPSMKETCERGPLSQNETVFMKRFGGGVHHTKNKIFD